MPAYRVEIQHSAERDLGRLSKTLFDRVAEHIAALGDMPRPPGAEKLAGMGLFRVRVGDYRILYEINDRARVVIVTRIRHRREVYRRLR